MKAMLCVAILLAPCAHDAVASEIHRCVSPRGQISYQAKPCEQGLRQDRVIEYQPVADSKPAQPETRQTARRKPAQPGKPRTKRPHSDADRCRLAREQHARALQNLGLKRTYDQLSKLDEAERAACR